MEDCIRGNGIFGDEIGIAPPRRIRFPCLGRSGFGSEASNAPAAATNAATPPGDPTQMYQAAYLDYTKGNYDMAIQGFREFLKAFPDAEFSGNAQYWVGESLYSLGKYEDALPLYERGCTLREERVEALTREDMLDLAAFYAAIDFKGWKRWSLESLPLKVRSAGVRLKFASSSRSECRPPAFSVTGILAEPPLPSGRLDSRSCFWRGHTLGRVGALKPSGPPRASSSAP